jgi:SnoaL-like polyketide cyclase
MTTTTVIDVHELMALWATPPADDAAALARIRSLYTDPVLINGTSFAAPELLTRIRSMHAAYRDLEHELLDQVDAPGRLVVAFRLRGVHVGPLATALGTVSATGRAFEVRVIDILTCVGSRVSEVTMVADEFGQLGMLGALTLARSERTALPSEVEPGVTDRKDVAAAAAALGLDQERSRR